MPEVVCLGELLIDFVSTVSGVTLSEAPAFQKAPGGAPANVAVGLARLGVSCAFMGKVGDDDFGRFLADTLTENGVNIASLRFSDAARTALAFVSLQADGERDFMFYRHPSADMLFTPDEVDGEVIQSARLLHFGSITLIGDPSRSATLHALDIAQKAGLMITYDPNLRLSLWPDDAAARNGIMLGWPYAQFIKVSRDELHFLAQTSDEVIGVNTLWHNRLKLLIVTDGSAGCQYFTSSHTGKVLGFPVETVDTTGAGDGFVAGLIKGILDDPQLADNRQALENALRYANAVGAWTTTKRGAIPALPTSDQIKTLLTDHD